MSVKSQNRRRMAPGVFACGRKEETCYSFGNGCWKCWLSVSQGRGMALRSFKFAFKQSLGDHFAGLKFKGRKKFLLDVRSNVLAFLCEFLTDLTNPEIIILRNSSRLHSIVFCNVLLRGCSEGIDYLWVVQANFELLRLDAVLIGYVPLDSA